MINQDILNILIVILFCIASITLMRKEKSENNLVKRFIKQFLAISFISLAISIITKYLNFNDLELEIDFSKLEFFKILPGFLIILEYFCYYGSIFIGVYLFNERFRNII